MNITNITIQNGAGQVTDILSIGDIATLQIDVQSTSGTLDNHNLWFNPKLFGYGIYLFGSTSTLTGYAAQVNSSTTTIPMQLYDNGTLATNTVNENVSVSYTRVSTSAGKIRMQFYVTQDLNDYVKNGASPSNYRRFLFNEPNNTAQLNNGTPSDYTSSNPQIGITVWTTNVSNVIVDNSTVTRNLQQLRFYDVCQPIGSTTEEQCCKGYLITTEHPGDGHLSNTDTTDITWTVPTGTDKVLFHTIRVDDVDETQNLFNDLEVNSTAVFPTSGATFSLTIPATAPGVYRMIAVFYRFNGLDYESVSCISDELISIEEACCPHMSSSFTDYNTGAANCATVTPLERICFNMCIGKWAFTCGDFDALKEQIQLNILSSTGSDILTSNYASEWTGDLEVVDSEDTLNVQYCFRVPPDWVNTDATFNFTLNFNDGTGCTYVTTLSVKDFDETIIDSIEFTNDSGATLQSICDNDDTVCVKACLSVVNPEEYNVIALLYPNDYSEITIDEEESYNGNLVKLGNAAIEAVPTGFDASGCATFKVNVSELDPNAKYTVGVIAKPKCENDVCCTLNGFC